MIQAIESRDKKLEEVGEIHRINRDVAEAVARIQEKEESDDTGGDTKSVHEGFKNDLVALEAQLQVLIKESAALQVRSCCLILYTLFAKVSFTKQNLIFICKRDFFGTYCI